MPRRCKTFLYMHPIKLHCNIIFIGYASLENIIKRKTRDLTEKSLHSENVKKSRGKVKLVIQSALLFLSRQVWSKCTCQFNFKSSCTWHTNVGVLPSILAFSMIMSAKVFESLSIWRWWKACPQASYIPKYIPHILARKAS